MKYSTVDEESWISSSKRWNDFQWAPDSQPTFQTKRPRTSNWQCGNPKKLNELFEHFSRYASLHGTHYVCSNKRSSKLGRFIHRIFFLFCLVSVALSVTFLVQDSVRKESVYINTINKDFESGILEDPLIPLFPSVTICRKPSYKTDMNESMLELVEYAYLALGYPFPSLTPQERSYLVQISTVPNSKALAAMFPKAAAYKKKLKLLKQKYENFKQAQDSFDLGTFISSNSVKCKDIFIDCFVMVFQLPCCKVFRAELTSSGICYVMKRNQQVEYVEQKLKSGFSLILDLKAASFVKKPLDMGYQIYLSDPAVGSVLVTPADALNALSGFITSVNVKLVKTQRTNLYRSWHGLSAECPTLPKELNPDGKYNDRFIRRVCDKNFYLLDLQRHCNCTSVMVTSPTNLPICNPEQLYGCSINMALQDNLTRMQEACYDPCTEYTYTTESSYIHLGGFNNSRVMITYDAKQFVYNEYQRTTFSSFLSQIGGALGLYLGASIITAMELLIFIGSWCWYRFMPNKSSKVDQLDPIFNPRMKKSITFYD